MSENKHTPEPWQVFEDDPRAIVTKENPMLSLLSVGEDGLAIMYEEADARRIVACVNRLAQFTTEQIEDFGYDLFAEDRPRLVEAQNEIHLLKKQRDELLAFAEEVRRSGDTRLASMAIATIASVKEKK